MPPRHLGEGERGEEGDGVDEAEMGGAERGVRVEAGGVSGKWRGVRVEEGRGGIG